MIKRLSLLASALLLAASGSVHAVPTTQPYAVGLTNGGFTLPLFDTGFFGAPLEAVSVAINWSFSAEAQLKWNADDTNGVLPVSFAPRAQLTFSDGGLTSFEQYLSSHSGLETFGPTPVVLVPNVSQFVPFGATGSLLATYSSVAGADLSYFSDTTNSNLFGVFCQSSALELDPVGTLSGAGVAASVSQPANFSCGGTVTYTFDDGEEPPTNGAPEPGSMALVGLALAGLGLTARRRNAR